MRRRMSLCGQFLQSVCKWLLASDSGQWQGRLGAAVLVMPLHKGLGLWVEHRVANLLQQAAGGKLAGFAFIVFSPVLATLLR